MRARRRTWTAVLAGLCLALTGCTGETAPQVAAPSSAPGGDNGATSGAAENAAASSVPVPAFDRELATGLSLPWSMAPLPDGSVLVSERDSALIKRLADGNVQEVGSIPDALAGVGEGGLLGLAVSPDFAQDQLVFAYFTGAQDNRVVRFTFDGATLGQPEPILTGIPSAQIHNGGRIKFGPDGFLYVATGDATQQGSAQDPSSLGGKILRITATGAPAPGNPTEGSPVYSLGHRNVQGLAWDSVGRLWATEFGADVNDELNLIQPGGNYGWPEVTGAPGRAGFVDAQVVWPSPATASPSGMAIIDDIAYIGALRGERLRQVPLRGGAAAEPIDHFQDRFGRLRDAIQGPDGALWVANNAAGATSSILRFGVK
jgi:glucose/arabinose dehydrogenase